MAFATFVERPISLTFLSISAALILASALASLRGWRNSLLSADR